MAVPAGFACQAVGVTGFVVGSPADDCGEVKGYERGVAPNDPPVVDAGWLG
ncbi:MAG: hypothetical protein ACUVQG_12680 [Thermogutta sp.]